MTTTLINGRKVIQIRAGDSLVYLQREGQDRKRPMLFDLEYTHKEWMRLVNGTDPLSPGDQLFFPHDFGQAWVSVELKTEKLWDYWAQTVSRHFPAYPMTCPALTATFAARDTCLCCDTNDLHHVEMPDLTPDPGWAVISRRYVLRQCITCDNHWEQECQW
ncbi:hypothetical protein SEA_TYPHA_87 [Mycobacterium phage Typha]|uniref:Uncharacterized protein n=1 Tax=Mycobacterium phage Typha TaxID=2517971 RepID=A0A482JDQ6_9CAUD|nr:hypothetical protein KCH40_gp082 [Mycobacterium phage Typha]QBP29742.1 hypothetical protein SEA_TYPHA_87 [Mycobacterium phage Typha]